MASDDEVKALSKKERREKKEKKEKKDKKRSRTEPEVDAADPDTGDETAATPAKKRKRDALPDEIEIDVNLPEPASKKAARKAKKAKTNPSAADDKDGAADGQAGAQTKEEKEQAGKRSEFGVWIGNLPWSATKDSLRDFLVEYAEMKPAQITRVHLPPPTKPVNPNWTTKPLNKGFAYVDFSTELAMYSAIALTETKMDGRALLIKNAKSFEGRPDKPKTEEAHDSGRGGKGAVKPGHPPNKRVFVGNLSFDVTKEDLQAHYAPCGPVEHIHMATFEDSGKCKGYAWVTFADIEASTAAVKGFVFKDESAFKNKDKKNSDDEGDSKQSGKQRKWFVSKLFGRDLRCEFAEDSTTRYNKRYGKDKPESHEPVDGVNPDRWKNFSKGGDERGGRRDAQEGRPRKKVDPRTIKSGAAHSNAPRASQAIVASQGKRMTFD
ncbi:hypothetical protein IQ07DRAFT_609536 [Pyrenochaeta sp. DS3sAY3a]|nr:hypothetical protein IQ07DRAFT_609536 [Pyrenochaeta sp. DS3sAY3a]